MRCSPFPAWGPVCSALSLTTLLAGQTQFDELRVQHMPDDRLCGRAVACADVDGDGDVDVVVGHLASSCRLYLNVGGQLVDAPAGALPPTPVHTAALAFADVDGDGDVDLAQGTDPFLGRQDNLYLNDGSGRFTDVTAERFPAVPTVTRALSFGDVDGDGDRDLLVAAGDVFGLSTQTARLWENDGTGRFTDATARRLPGAPDSLAGTLADFDGDGDPDAFFGTRQADELHVNDGTGIFALQRGAVPAIAAGTGSATVADVDIDGDLDVLAVGGDLLYRNDGTGYFLEVSSSALSGVMTQLYRAVFADENDDGLPDLVATTADGLAIYNAATPGVFRSTPRIIPLDAGWSALDVADIDGNGHEDVVVATGNQSPHRLFFNPGSIDGGSTLFPEPLPGVTAAGDFNGDGSLDIAAWTPLEGAIWYQRPGRFERSAPGSLPVPTEVVLFALPVDIDGDSRLDLALIVRDDRTLRRRVQLLVRAPIAFVDQTASRLPVQPPSVGAIAAGDVDGDGDADLVVGSSLLRNENGSFVTTAIGSISPLVTPILADADGDGDLDLFAATRVFLNDGTGEFTEGWVSPVVQRFQAVADADGDGDPDLFTGPLTSLGGLRLWLNTGSGFFEEATPGAFPAAASQYGEFAVGDLDGDGDPDVYAAGAGSAGPADEWFVNDGAGRFRPAPAGRGADAGNGAQLGPLADWDSDSDLDLLLWRGSGAQCSPSGSFLIRNLYRQIDVPLLPRAPGSLTIDAYFVDGGGTSTRFALPSVGITASRWLPIPGLGLWALPPSSIHLPPIAVTGPVSSASYRLPALPFPVRFYVQAIMIPSADPATWSLSNVVERSTRR